MKAAALAFCVALAACDTTRDVVAVCPPVKAYTRAQQAALAQAMATIPDGGPLALAMLDYEQLRDAARACAGAKP